MAVDRRMVYRDLLQVLIDSQLKEWFLARDSGRFIAWSDDEDAKASEELIKRNKVTSQHCAVLIINPQLHLLSLRVRY